MTLQAGDTRETYVVGYIGRVKGSDKNNDYVIRRSGYGPAEDLWEASLHIP